MENSINRVKGRENLFNKYIRDAEKELNKGKGPKTSMQPSSGTYILEKMLEEYLKQLKTRKKISSPSSIKNKTKIEQRTLISPITKVLGTIEQNVEFLVNQFVGVFKVKPSSTFQSKDRKLPNNDKVSRKILMKNKKRNCYYVNCNKLSRFSGLNKRMITRNRKYPSTYTLEELKTIIDLGNVENNTVVDWYQYGQHFINNGERQVVPHDSTVDENKAYLTSMSYINHFTNVTQTFFNKNCIIFYNNENKNNDKKYGNSPNTSKEQTLVFKLGKTRPDKESDIFHYANEPTRNDRPKMPEYLVYTGFVENTAKTKVKRGQAKQKSRKKEPKQAKTKQKKESGGFCFICKKIKACLCGTKPDVVSESPSAQGYTAHKELEEMVDPESFYNENENDYLNKTLVYSAMSEPNFKILDQISRHEMSKKPVVCSIDITGSDTGNIVIRDGSKLHNLGFKINDWYLKPVPE